MNIWARLAVSKQCLAEAVANYIKSNESGPGFADEHQDIMRTENKRAAGAFPRGPIWLEPVTCFFRSKGRDSRNL